MFKDVKLDDGISGGRTKPAESVDDLDFDQFDFDSDVEKDDRSPVTQAIHAAKDGVWSVVEDDYDTMAGTLADVTIPDRLKTEVTSVNDVLEKHSDDYNKVTNEIKGDVVSVANAIGTILPEGKIKSALRNTKEAIGYKTPGNGGYDNAEKRANEEITDKLNSIFGDHALLQKKDSLRQEAKDDINRAVDRKRDDLTKEVLMKISDSVGSSFTYKVDIESKFQRKTLELQFKQVFLAKESLKKSQGYFETSTKLLTAISKNTALPEVTKIKGLEVLEQQGAQRLAEKALNTAFADGGFLKTKMNNIARYGKSKLEDLSSLTSMAAMGADSFADVAEMGGPNEIIKDAARSGAKIGLRKAHQMVAARNGGDNRYRKITDWGYDKVFGIPYRINEMARDRANKIDEEDLKDYGKSFGEKYKEEKGFLGKSGLVLNSVKKGLGGFVKNKVLLGLHEALNYSDKDSNINLADKTEYKFDKTFYTSVTTVIPSFLSKILKEVSTVNGNPIDEEYNHRTDEFLTGDKRAKIIKDGLKNSDSIDTYRTQVDELINNKFGDFVGDDETKRERLRTAFYKQAELAVGKGKDFYTYLDMIDSGAINKDTDSDLVELFESKEAEERATPFSKGRYQDIQKLDIPNLREYGKATHSMYGKDGLVDSGLFDLKGNLATVKDGSLVDLLNSAEPGTMSSIKELRRLVRHNEINPDDLEVIDHIIGTGQSHLIRAAIDVINDFGGLGSENIEESKRIFYVIKKHTQLTNDRGEKAKTKSKGALRFIKDVFKGTKKTLTDFDTKHSITKKGMKRAKELDKEYDVSGKLDKAFDEVDKKTGVKKKYLKAKLKAIRKLRKKHPNLSAKDVGNIVDDAFTKFADDPDKALDDIITKVKKTSESLDPEEIQKKINEEMGSNSKMSFLDSIKKKFGIDSSKEIVGPQLPKEPTRSEVLLDELVRVTKAFNGYTKDEEVKVDIKDPDRKKPVSEKITAALTKEKESAYNDADGSGRRDGSWKDRLFNLKGKKNSEENIDPKKPVSEKDKGLLGKILTFLPAILGGTLSALGSVAGNLFSPLMNIPGMSIIAPLLGAGAKGAGNLALGATKLGGKAALKAGKSKVMRKIFKKLGLALSSRGGMIGLVVGGLMMTYGYWDEIQGVFEGGITKITERLGDSISKTSQRFEASMASLKDSAVDSLSDIQDWVSEKASSISNGITKIMDGDSTYLADSWDYVKDKGKKGITGAGEVLSDAGDALSGINDILSYGTVSGLTRKMFNTRRDGQDTIDWARMLQYGIPINDQSPTLVFRIMQVERALFKNRFIIRSGENYRLAPTEQMVNMVWHTLNLGEKKADRVEVFNHWFAGRFIPVLLRHIEVRDELKISSVVGDTKGKIPEEKRSEYVTKAIMELDGYAEIYKVDHNPFTRRGVGHIITEPTIITQYAQSIINRYSSKAKTVDNVANGSVKSAILDFLFPVAQADTLADIEKTKLEAEAKIRQAKLEGKPIDSPAVTRGRSQGRASGVNAEVLAEVKRISAEGKTLAKVSMNTPAGNIGDLKVPISAEAINRLDPAVRTALLQMGTEYYQLTGEKLQVNSGWRSAKGQAAVRDKNPDIAAAKKSIHEYGWAIDINQKQVDRLMRLGILNKYGFNRPLDGGRERHHIEPTVLQGNTTHFKRSDPGLMTSAFDLGRGIISFGLGEGVGKGNIRRSGKSEVSLDKIRDHITNPKSKMVGSMQPEDIGDKAYIPDAGLTSMVSDSVKSSVIPQPNMNRTGRTKDQDVLAVINKAAAKYGINPDTLKVILAKESSLDPNASNPRSSALGLGQILDSTWEDWLATPDSKAYSPDRKDPLSNAMASAWYISNNLKGLKKYVDKPDKDPTYSYLITLLGPTGARRFLGNLTTNPDGPVSSGLTSAQIRSNSAYFMTGSRACTYKEAFNKIQKHLKKTAGEFKLNFPGSTSPKQAAVKLEGNYPITLKSNRDTSSPSVSQERSHSKVPAKATVTDVPKESVVKLDDSGIDRVVESVQAGSSKSDEMIGYLKIIADNIMKAQPPAKQTAQPQTAVAKAPPVAPPFNVSN